MWDKGLQVSTLTGCRQGNRNHTPAPISVTMAVPHDSAKPAMSTESVWGMFWPLQLLLSCVGYFT